MTGGFGWRVNIDLLAWSGRWNEKDKIPFVANHLLG